MAGGPLVVGVADILHRPGARRHEHLVAPVGELRVVDTVVPADEDVDVDVVLDPVTEGILASGSARTRWRALCRRCLRPVEGEADAEFRELFEPHPTDGETYPLRHEQVDLAPLAREALLLELPLAPLCREDCRGICPTCGADLNEGPCSCAPSDRDPRWAALDALRTDDKTDDE